MLLLRSSILSAGLHSLVFAPGWGRPALELFRDRQMRLLLQHAYTHVAYYQELFDRSKLKPSDIRTVNDLSAIPITFRKDIQLLQAEKVTARGTDQKKLIVRRSSGSTGEPFATRRTWFEEHLLQAFRRRALHLLGQQPWDKVVSISRVRAIDPNDYQLPLRMLNALGLYRTEHIDCFLPFSEIISRIQRNRFDILGGLTSVLYHLAIHINQKDPGIIPPRFITTGGEAITPHMRREIETAFGTRVYDVYGCHEFNLLVCQCKETGDYHICDDSVIVEIVKDGRPARTGEQGEVVATGLFSYSMPLIRYHVGDVVVQGSDSCPCGGVFSTIREIQGRTMDYLALEDGRYIHPYQIICFLVHADKPWVRQYQLVQKSAREIFLKVAPLRPIEPGILQQLENNVCGVLGRRVSFRIELVDGIQREESGKFKAFKSLVPPMDCPKAPNSAHPKRVKAKES